jgi:preprotein translocase subunit YajC
MMVMEIILMMGQGGEQGGGSLLGFLPFILIILVMYFLMIRPQVRRQKERQKMIDAVQKGDNIITTGGIHGKIMGFTDDGKTVIVRIDDNVKINIDRSAINSVRGPQRQE